MGEEFVIKIFLKHLSIENFKGIKSLDLVPERHNYLSGRNGTGKTCVFDAYCYLLFGRNSHDRPDFSAYPADDRGDPFVEGIFDIDGRELVLCVTITKKWELSDKPPRFKGFETKRFVNGKAVTREEYFETIDDLCEADLFKILTNPCAIDFIPWLRLRKILTRLSPETPYKAVAAADARLKIVAVLLEDDTPEDAKRRLASEISEKKAALGEIPVKRGEVSLNMGEEWDIAEIDIKIEGIKEEIKEIQRLIALKTKPNEMQAELSRLENIKRKAELEFRERELERKNKMADLERELRDKNNEMQHLSYKLKKLENRLYEAKRRSEELERRAEERQNDKPEISEYCSLCGNKLKKRQIEAIGEKLATEKKEELKGIYGEYELSLFEVNSLKDEIEKNCSHINKLKEESASINNRLSKLRRISDKNRDSDVDSAIMHLKARLEPVYNETDRLKEYLIHLNERFEQLYETKNRISANINAKKRLTELSEEEKRLRDDIKELKYKDSLLDELIKRTMEYQSEKINSHFDSVYFKMYRNFIKGGSENCCIAEIDGVEYADLNHGGKIMAGLDLIKGLSDYFGIYVPIFIDNRESLTSLCLTESQIFELTVSDEKELKCRYE